LTWYEVRHIVLYTKSSHQTVSKSTPKIDRLRQAGMLNPQPQRVLAAWFQTGGFFDANDLVQVKYEMLRHAQQEGVTKAQAASLFGLSRPTYYQAEAAFERDGMAGLLPQPRGPKSAHKLTPEVMGVIDAHHTSGAPLQAREMAKVVHAQLGLTVHPRSIERAVARKKKR
jgi:transposase